MYKIKTFLLYAFCSRTLVVDTLEFIFQNILADDFNTFIRLIIFNIFFFFYKN